MARQVDFGKHYLAELGGCEQNKLKYVRDVKRALLNAAQKSKATILRYHFYQFKPHGVSGIIMIAESHFAIHTWPESNFAAFDVLTCGKMSPQKAIQELKKSLKAKRVKVRVLKRGF